MQWGHSSKINRCFNKTSEYIGDINLQKDYT